MTGSRRYIFVDGGAHQGQSIKWFMRSAIFEKYPWEIFAFEVNPHLILDINQPPDLTIVDKAIWVSDGAIDFYLAKKTNGSSILRHKKQGGLSKIPIRVGSINFGKWLEDNFSKSDYILVKFDIEGAEYAVLDQMIADGSMKYVSGLFVEFHNTMVKIPTSKDAELLNKLKKLGIPCWVCGRFSKLLKEAIINNELGGLVE